MTGDPERGRKGEQQPSVLDPARAAPTNRAECDWWNTEETEHTPLRNLIESMDEIAQLPVPYARLPRRLTAYAQEFPRWSDIAGQSPHELLSRPKVGVAAVRALVDAARDAVKTYQETAAAHSVGAEVAVDSLVERLDEYDRAILSARLWAPRPQSQRVVAERLGVNPVSVQRNQPRAQARFAELLVDPAHRAVGEHAARLRECLGPYLPVDVAATELRRLGIDPDTQAAHVLLYVAGPYVRRGDWIENTTAGGQSRAAAAVEAVFARTPAPAVETLVNALTELGMPADVPDIYLETHLTLRRFGDVCVRWSGDTTANMAEAVLHARGAPATAEDIHSMIGAAATTLATINGTLSEDYRFIRTSRRQWALRAWGISEYLGIAHAIGARIDAHGGRAQAKDVTAEVLSQFPDVAETSIRSYLSSLEFVKEAGMVRRRTRKDKLPPVAALNTVRGAFRNGHNEIRLAVTVTREMLRGSGQAIHPAVAREVGVNPGQRRTFTSPLGEVAVFWKLSSTSGAGIGSLRAHALAAAAVPADTIVLAFRTQDASLEVTRLGASIAGRERLRCLLGRTVRSPVAALAASLDCTQAQAATVLRNRGDHEVADLIES